MTVEVYRRRLPHVRLAGAVYFVTWRLAQTLPELSAGERDMVATALHHFEGMRYRLHAYVVMNDHIHAIVEPLGRFHLDDILHSWKSFSARRINRRRQRNGALWQSEYFDRVIRDGAEYEEKRDYVLANPFRRWPALQAYRWCWARGMETT